MATTKNVILIKDSVTFTVDKIDLTVKQVGGVLKTSERNVPHGLKWHVEWYPAGESRQFANHLSVYMYVNNAVSGTVTFKVHRPDRVLQTTTYEITSSTSIGCHRLASHETIRSWFGFDVKLSITCEVSFIVDAPITLAKPCLAYSDHVPTDFALVVDSNRIRVHKSFLSLLSPVFHAMLSHDTAESKRGEVEIKDFDFKTIKTVVHYCYGCDLKKPSIETIISILRFADKYNIKAITSVLEKMPQFLTAETFPALLRYADDFFKNNMFDECCKFFKKHQKDIVRTHKFPTLAPAIVVRLLKQVFGLTTQFGVLRYAHYIGIYFVLDPLERPLYASLSLNTFCNTVSYAWDCSRDNLMTACSDFFNENVTEICEMKSFNDLGLGAVYGVMTHRMDFQGYRQFFGFLWSRFIALFV